MWINCIRLAVWERSRCQEIYTGVLLGLKEPRISQQSQIGRSEGVGGWIGFDGGLNTSTTSNGGSGGGKGVINNTGGGKFEGWLKARLPGDTEWRKVYTVVTKGVAPGGSNTQSSTATKKSRRSSLLSFGRNSKNGGNDAVLIDDLPGDGALATIAFYAGKPVKKDQPLCIVQHCKFNP